MKLKRWIYYLLQALGTVFCLWYIKEATCDIVYTDYIRLVNKYLPDVWSAENFFRPDVLTRIPVCYLGRIINVYFFNYSTTFDMGLGARGLGLTPLVLGRYSDTKQEGLVWYSFLMFLLFGLNKWEMLTNGSGWPHFLAFGCFYYHYLVFDRVLYGEEKKHDRILLLALPALITILVAGPYCAVYSVVLILSCAFACLSGRLDKRYCMAGVASVVIPLLLYMWSNSYASEDHDGAIKISLGEMFLERPEFFPNFLVRSMASMVVGEETIRELVEKGLLSDNGVYLMGVLLAGGYLLALYLNVRCRLYERTLVPLMLLFAGMGNHGIILVSRYIFGREEYGMSSRYALQYQAGVLGMVLTFALVWKVAERSGQRAGRGGPADQASGLASTVGPAGAAASPRPQMGTASRMAALAFCLMLLMGHGYTNYRELQKAPYREEYGENIARAALQYEILSDDELRRTFDYREGREESAADVRRALGILKEHGWNVFGRQ